MVLRSLLTCRRTDRSHIWAQRLTRVFARIDCATVPRLASVEHYLEQGCTPGGTHRNFASYGERIAPPAEAHKLLLCDPQTSGGLLIAVAPEGEAEFLATAAELGLALAPIGELCEPQRYAVEVA